ncbi:MAG TPA: hypothetical protein VFW87_14590 [Pirellulales bacterium]|nr:hypothetical protein [Pirellulales bacterium]
MTLPSMDLPFHIIRDILDKAENQGVRPAPLRRLLQRFLFRANKPRRRRRRVAVRPR